jgi:hypothetical protein
MSGTTVNGGSHSSKLSQSGNDAKKPEALARIYLEDGTVLTGRSFGCHKSAEGQVRIMLCQLKRRVFLYNQF